ncbi:MAG: type II secretion system minor pseudopilin GspH [Endozoicomonas sp.]|uniref:type II secretion system minor pseudopilin GspH n=1 Tax=Endozoicomonas sp. TaxID=1892382 RepID=UPI003D9BD7BD
MAVVSSYKITQPGFTLIELMVVLLVLGVIASLVTLTPRMNQSSAVVQQAERLEILFKSLRDKAFFQNQTYGWVLKPDGYHWLRWNPDHARWENWEEAEFQPVSFPEAWQATLEQDFTFNSLFQSEPATALVIFPDYQMSPFRLSLANADRSQTAVLTTDGLNDVAIQ